MGAFHVVGMGGVERLAAASFADAASAKDAVASFAETCVPDLTPTPNFLRTCVLQHPVSLLLLHPARIEQQLSITVTPAFPFRGLLVQRP